MELADIKAVKQVISQFDFSFSKDFGQNFLIDPRIPEQISEACCDPGDFVLEIGPGMGTLTSYLGRRAERVGALELDKRLIPVLGETLKEYNNVHVFQGDLLKTDLNCLSNNVFGEDTPCVAVSNLPYCITTKAVLALLECRRFDRVTVMIQREAAKKLLCEPADEEWCLWSSICNFYSKIESVGRVSKGCFYPQPSVDSEIVRFFCRKDITEDVCKAYRRIASALFSSRRKTIRNTLALSQMFCEKDFNLICSQLDIDAGARGESLTVEQTERLAKYLIQE